jgi:protein TonB
MTGALKTTLAVSIGLHTGILLGWPTTSSVQFDVERAATSFEIRLIAPRHTPVTPHAVVESPPPRETPPSEPSPDVVEQPDPVEETIVTPESQGALSEVLPGYLRNPAPAYPWLARQRGEQGTVVLAVEVLPTGRCGELHVRSSSGSSVLDAAAATAIRRWQFNPARRAGDAVSVWVEIPVTFQLIESGGR